MPVVANNMTTKRNFTAFCIFLFLAAK